MRKAPVPSGGSGGDPARSKQAPPSTNRFSASSRRFKAAAKTASLARSNTSRDIDLTNTGHAVGRSTLVGFEAKLLPPAGTFTGGEAISDSEESNVLPGVGKGETRQKTNKTLLLPHREMNRHSPRNVGVSDNESGGSDNRSAGIGSPRGVLNKSDTEPLQSGVPVVITRKAAGRQPGGYPPATAAAKEDRAVSSSESSAAPAAPGSGNTPRRGGPASQQQQPQMGIPKIRIEDTSVVNKSTYKQGAAAAPTAATTSSAEVPSKASTTSTPRGGVLGTTTNTNKPKPGTSTGPPQRLQTADAFSGKAAAALVGKKDKSPADRRKAAAGGGTSSGSSTLTVPKAQQPKPAAIVKRADTDSKASGSGSKTTLPVNKSGATAQKETKNSSLLPPAKAQAGVPNKTSASAGGPVAAPKMTTVESPSNATATSKSPVAAAANLPASRTRAISREARAAASSPSASKEATVAPPASSSQMVPEDSAGDVVENEAPAQQDEDPAPVVTLDQQSYAAAMGDAEEPYFVPMMSSEKPDLVEKGKFLVLSGRTIVNHMGDVFDMQHHFDRDDFLLEKVKNQERARQAKKELKDLQKQLLVATTREGEDGQSKIVFIANNVNAEQIQSDESVEPVLEVDVVGKNYTREPFYSNSKSSTGQGGGGSKGSVRSGDFGMMNHTRGGYQDAGLTASEDATATAAAPQQKSYLPAHLTAKQEVQNLFRNNKESKKEQEILKHHREQDKMALQTSNLLNYPSDYADSDESESNVPHHFLIDDRLAVQEQRNSIPGPIGWQKKKSIVDAGKLSRVELAQRIATGSFETNLDTSALLGTIDRRYRIDENYDSRNHLMQEDFASQTPGGTTATSSSAQAGHAALVGAPIGMIKLPSSSKNAMQQFQLPQYEQPSRQVADFQPEIIDIDLILKMFPPVKLQNRAPPLGETLAFGTGEGHGQNQVSTAGGGANFKAGKGGSSSSTLAKKLQIPRGAIQADENLLRKYGVEKEDLVFWNRAGLSTSKERYLNVKPVVPGVGAVGSAALTTEVIPSNVEQLLPPSGIQMRTTQPPPVFPHQFQANNKSDREQIVSTIMQNNRQKRTPSSKRTTFSEAPTSRKTSYLSTVVQQQPGGMMGTLHDKDNSTTSRFDVRDVSFKRYQKAFNPQAFFENPNEDAIFFKRGSKLEEAEKKLEQQMRSPRSGRYVVKVFENQLGDPIMSSVPNTAREMVRATPREDDYYSGGEENQNENPADHAEEELQQMSVTVTKNTSKKDKKSVPKKAKKQKKERPSELAKQAEQHHHLLEPSSITAAETRMKLQAKLRQTSEEYFDKWGLKFDTEHEEKLPEIVVEYEEQHEEEFKDHQQNRDKNRQATNVRALLAAAKKEYGDKFHGEKKHEIFPAFVPAYEEDQSSNSTSREESGENRTSSKSTLLEKKKKDEAVMQKTSIEANFIRSKLKEKFRNAEKYLAATSSSAVSSSSSSSSSEEAEEQAQQGASAQQAPPVVVASAQRPPPAESAPAVPSLPERLVITAGGNTSAPPPPPIFTSEASKGGKGGKSTNTMSTTTTSGSGKNSTIPAAILGMSSGSPRAPPPPAQAFFQAPAAPFTLGNVPSGGAFSYAGLSSIPSAPMSAPSGGPPSAPLSAPLSGPPSGPGSGPPSSAPEGDHYTGAGSDRGGGRIFQV
ncbi:unnamed protein product [Amoebophrya sp. A120]|nr:unnamed protein product [Amoebophrya sp. A120]|eukprot:GSA120T00014362001.1